MTSPDKAELRRVMARRRRALAPEWVQAASRRAGARLFDLEVVAGAGLVGCYMSLPGEVLTDTIMEACRRLGKDLCVPALNRATRQYGLARVEPGTVWSAGPAGVREPADPAWVPSGQVDVIVVPGVAFDAQGGRLGHGGGHYDRMLADRDMVPVGLAFEFQLVPQLPREAHDVPMQTILTEERTIVPLAAHEVKEEACMP